MSRPGPTWAAANSYFAAAHTFFSSRMPAAGGDAPNVRHPVRRRSPARHRLFRGRPLSCRRPGGTGLRGVWHNGSAPPHCAGADPLPAAGRQPGRRVPCPHRHAAVHPQATSGAPTPVATKIKLMRLGKMREPHYRIVVADARTTRNGRADRDDRRVPPEERPVGHQASTASGRRTGSASARSRPRPSPPSCKVTGDWQKFAGEPAPPPMKVAPPKAGQARAVQRRAGRRRRRAPRPRPPRRASARRRRPRRPPSPRPPQRAADASPPRRPPRPPRPSRPPRPAADEPAPSRRADVLEEALEHLVRGHRRPPGRRPGGHDRQPARPAARGPRAPRGPRPGHRPQRPDRQGAAQVVATAWAARGIRVDVVDVDGR